MDFCHTSMSHSVNSSKWIKGKSSFFFIVEKAVDMVKKSKKPLLIIGSQCMLPPTSTERLKAAVESMGIPCYLGGMARGLLGRDSSIQMRHSRRDALREADCIILAGPIHSPHFKMSNGYVVIVLRSIRSSSIFSIAGAVCDFRLSYGRGLNRRAKIIAVNRNKEQLWKNSDLFWKPSVAVECDVGNFICQLSASLAGFEFTCPADWVQKLREKDEVTEKKNKDVRSFPF